jgi:hypothetical protein
MQAREPAAITVYVYVFVCVRAQRTDKATRPKKVGERGRNKGKEEGEGDRERGRTGQTVDSNGTGRDDKRKTHTHTHTHTTNHGRAWCLIWAQLGPNGPILEPLRAHVGPVLGPYVFDMAKAITDLDPTLEASSYVSCGFLHFTIVFLVCAYDSSLIVRCGHGSINGQSCLGIKHANNENNYVQVTCSSHVKPPAISIQPAARSVQPWAHLGPTGPRWGRSVSEGTTPSYVWIQCCVS